MKNNMIRQQKAYIEKHGAPMSKAQLQHMHTTIFALQSLYYEDGASESDAKLFLHDMSYWRNEYPNHSFEAEELHASLEEAAAVRAAAAAASSSADGAAAAVPDGAALNKLTEDGYMQGTQPTARVVALCASLEAALGALVEVISRLSDLQDVTISSHYRIASQSPAQLLQAGLPPNFIFVFNEAWLLLEEHWASSAAGILGADSVMEADMNVWSLRRPPPPPLGADAAAAAADGDVGEANAAEEYVGGNFSASHRDQKYSSCHSDDGTPTSVNLWFPFNASGATATNGAMRVLPIPHDDFFYSPAHPAHMNTKISVESADDDAVQILACTSGTACMWSPALVHWGGGCEASSAAEPRASIAVTFRHSAAPPSEFGPNPAPPSGPPPLVRADLNNLVLSRRLAYVAKGILAYSHWHPGFPGIHLAKDE